MSFPAPYTFRISLRLEDSSYYAVINDAVVVQTTPFYIESPAGWDSLSITNAKNIELYGLERAYSVPFKFGSGTSGAKILRYVDYTQGPEGVCKIVIEYSDPITTEYRQLAPYPLDLDFSVATDDRDYFTVPIKEAGVPADIRAALDIEYELPIYSDPNAKVIDVSPLKAMAELRWVTETMVSNYPSPNPNTDGHIDDAGDRSLYLIGVKKTFIPVSDGGDFSPVTMGLLSTSNTIALGTPEGQYPTPRMPSGFFNKNLYTLFPYMFTAKVPLTDVTTKGSFDFKLFNKSGSAINFSFKVVKISYPAGSAVETFVWESTIYNVPDGVTHNGTETIQTPAHSMAVGEELFIYYTPHGAIGGSGFEITIEQGRYITTTFRYETEPFSFYALRGRDMFASLVSKISSSATIASSHLINQTTAILDSIPNNLFFTSGMAIRSQPLGNTIYGTAGSVMKISLSDVLKLYNTLYGSGLKVSNSGEVGVYRDRDFFNSAFMIADLGEVANCTLAKKNEYLFNSIKIGYPSITYDEVNGLDEFNTTQTYKTSGVRTIKELDLVSTIRADMWGIFFEWVKYVLEESKDSDSDNSTFVIECKSTANGSGHYEPVTGADITSLTGVIDPINSFNVALSPKHCFFRNGARIRSGLTPLDGTQIVFQTSDKNAEVISNTGSGVIIEKSNALASDLDTPLFLPWEFTVTAPGTPDLLSLMDINPYGYFRFTWKGNQYDIFPTEVSVQPSKPIATQIKGLSAPNNDMTLLVG